MGLPTRYISELLEHLQITLLHPVDKEMLHQLRVQIKKLRALWLIHPIGGTIEFKQSFPNIWTIFKLAAKARDRQMIWICLQTLPGFLKHEELQEKLEGQIKRAKKAVVKKISAKKFRINLYEELKKFKVYYRVAARFLVKSNKKNYRLNTFELLANLKTMDAHNLHNLRKMVKFVIYHTEAFEENHHHQGSLPPKDSLNKLQNLLGTWHDWWNVVGWLTKQKQTDADRQYESLIEQASKKEQLNKRALLTEIKILAVPKKTKHFKKPG